MDGIGASRSTVIFGPEYYFYLLGIFAVGMERKMGRFRRASTVPKDHRNRLRLLYPGLQGVPNVPVKKNVNNSSTIQEIYMSFSSFHRIFSKVLFHTYEIKLQTG